MKLYLVSGWATGSAIWNPVIGFLRDELDIEHVEWWAAIDGELGRRISGNSERYILAGWSMGGQIALMEAARKPDNLAGVFLISSMVSLVGNGKRPGVSRETPTRIKVMLERNRDACLRGFFNNCISPVRSKELAGNLLKESESIPVSGLLSGLKFMTDTEVRLTMDVPVMTVHGREDRIIPWKCSEYIGNHARNHFKTVYIDNAGHLLPLSEPETVGNLLNEFYSYCIS